MAQYKACCPIIAKLTETEKDGVYTYTYSNAVILGKLMKTSITPTTVEGKLYGDDGLAEYVNEATGADVSLDTTTIPLTAYGIMFGTTVDAESDTAEFSTSDNGSYVGYGFVIGVIESGVTKYKLKWLPKVKFALPSESFETKGENISFATPSISGQALPLDDGKWHKQTGHATAAAAIAALKTLANYTTT